MQKTIILASTSPRRSAILRQIGLTFAIDPAEIDERIAPEESPQQYALRIAEDKARLVAQRHAQGIVIAADTIVVVDGEVLGKPVSPYDAFRMLELLSGRMHEVMTGLAVHDIVLNKRRNGLSITRVWFRRLNRDEIGRYIATHEPLDKAGAYGIQERGAVFVDRIEGCYFNVVGLPVSLLGTMLQELDCKLLG